MNTVSDGGNGGGAALYGMERAGARATPLARHESVYHLRGSGSGEGVPKEAKKSKSLCC
jgi:hypothetical protein